MRDKILDLTDETLIFLEGPEFDEAIIGLDAIEPRLIYDKAKIITLLMQSMSEEEAEEFFDFNIAGLAGENFPIYVCIPQ